jgi:hypothetical protein
MLDLPFARHVSHYAIILLTTTLGLNLIAVLLTGYTPIAVPAGSFAVFPPILAALSAGRHWARLTGHLPDASELWRLASVAGLVYLAAQMLVIPLAAAGGTPVFDVMGHIAFVLLIATVVATLLHRVFFTLGARFAL